MLKLERFIEVLRIHVEAYMPMVYNACPRDPLLCTFCMCSLFRETYKKCRAVGSQDQDWKPLL